MKTNLLFLIIVLGISLSCKKNGSESEPKSYKSINLPVAISPGINPVATISSPLGTAIDGKIEVLENKENNYILGLASNDDVILMALPINGKIELNYESTAISMAKLILLPYAESDTPLDKQISAIKTSSSYAALLSSVTSQINKGLSPLDLDAAVNLAFDVAGEADAIITSGIQNQKSLRIEATDKHYLFSDLAGGSTQGHSYWIEEISSNGKISNLNAYNNSRLDWMLKVEDDKGKVLDSTHTEGIEFSDDFTKLTSYLVKDPDAKILKFADKYKVTIYQTDALRQKHLEKIIDGVFRILWDFIPWDDKKSECFGSYINKMIFTTLPKLKERVNLAKTESEKTEAIMKYLYETFLFEDSYESQQDFITTMIDCNPTYKSKANHGQVMKYLDNQSKLLRKLHKSFQKLIKPITIPAKVAKLGVFTYQFAANYNSKYEYNNITSGAESYLAFSLDNQEYFFYDKNNNPNVSQYPAESVGSVELGEQGWSSLKMNWIGITARRENNAKYFSMEFFGNTFKGVGFYNMGEHPTTQFFTGGQDTYYAYINSKGPFISTGIKLGDIWYLSKAGGQITVTNFKSKDTFEGTFRFQVEGYLNKSPMGKLQEVIGKFKIKHNYQR